MLSRETLISMLKNEYPSSYNAHDVENMGVKELDALLDYLDSMQNKAHGGMMLDNTKTYHQANDYTAPPDLEVMIGYANGGGVGSMMQPKKKKFEIQGGVKNYKPSKMVTAPKTAKSSPDHPTAHLAYITNEEKDLLIKKNLHGSLKGKPNRGPSGIISLQGDFGGGWGSYEGGADHGGVGSKGNTGDVSGFRDTGTGNYSAKGTSAADQAAKAQFDQAFGINSKGVKSGGFGFGNLLTGILGALMGIPGLGLITSGLSGLKDKFQGIRGYNDDGTPMTQEQWEQARQNRINEKRISNILNRKAPITEMTQKNLSKLGYTGAMPGIGSTPTSRAINKDFERGLNTLDGAYSTSHLNSIKANLPNSSYNKFSNTIGPTPNTYNRFSNTIGPNPAPTGIMKAGGYPVDYTMSDQFLNENPETRNMLGINRNFNTTAVNTNTYDDNVANWRNQNNINAINVGLNTKQKELLDQRKDMLGALGVQGIFDTITSEDDPDDPATIEDVKAYYNI